MWVFFAVDIKGKGYENIVVSISPDVSSAESDKVIEGIKKFVTEGSKRLFIATDGHLHIKTVKIIVPKVGKNGWDTVDNATDTDKYHHDHQ